MTGREQEPWAGHRARDVAFLGITLAAGVLAAPWLPGPDGPGAPARTPIITPPIALTIGLIVALVGLSAFESSARRAARVLIQCGVVLLGLRMNLHEVAGAGASGLLFAAGTIVGTFALGLAVGRRLKLDGQSSVLVCSGTAICGGSAIAAVGTAMRARSDQIAVATGVVFLLNAAALYLFPPIGHWLGLSDAQFGTWAGVAIHDISSVTGAASAYHAGGPALSAPEHAAGAGTAVDTATVVKLSRVLWIAPIAAAAGVWARKRDRGEQRAGNQGIESPPRSPDDAAPGRGWMPVPWFVLLFVAASALRTWAPQVGRIERPVGQIAAAAMTMALFLIGAGLSRRALAAVGWRALVQGLILWIAISVAALIVVRATIA